MKSPKILNLRFLGLFFCESHEIYGKIITLLVNKEVLLEKTGEKKGCLFGIDLK
jgi:hypothetical protein